MTYTLINRHYYRCLACLSAVAIDGDKLKVAYDHNNKPLFPRCDCGGGLDYMGRVSGDNYMRVEDRCACDGRCTHATGPNCDCACGGKNHGTGALATIIVEMGCVSKLTPRPDIDTRRALVAEVAYTANECLNRISTVHAVAVVAKKEGNFLAGDAYWNYRNAYSAYRKAFDNKSHKGRMAALNKIAIS